MFEKYSKKLKESLLLPIYLVAIMWAIQVVNWLVGLQFGWLGIYPREIFGLRGILFAPVIHGSWGHILSNTPPLFVMSAMLLFFYRRVAFPAFTMIYLLTGLAVWIFGRSVFHIGASGVIFGLATFLIANGAFRRDLKSIALALLVVFYYGSMFAGVLPGQPGVSWESHLLGGIVGIFASFWFKDSIEKDEVKVKYSWEEEPLERKNFFESNIFDTPKAERQKKENDYWSRF